MKKYGLIILATAAVATIGCKSGGGGGGEDTGSGEAKPDTGTGTGTGTGEAPEDTGTGTGEAPADTGTGTGEAPEDTGTGEATPCAGVKCNAPPQNSCDGTFGIEVANSVGWCDRGECYYGARSEVCVGTCEDGACTGAPCQGVTCNHPPEPECADEETLTVFNKVGYCAAPGGTPECRYSSRDVACEGGCEDGKCVDDPCANIICDDPPARYCDGDSLVVWDTIPRCENGECLYGMQTVACATGCENGRCVDDDPCANVICNTPPASYCSDDGTLRAFSRQGACHEGACIYLQEDLPCADGCRDGQCNGDICAGVDCGQVPAVYCIDDNTLASWDGEIGACIDGVCGYGAEAVTCNGGCENGICQEDPCQGAVCATPPPDYCVDDETLATFTMPGTCHVDGCTYVMDKVSCIGGCENGTCVEEGDTEVDTETGMGTGEEVDTETDTGSGTGEHMDTATDTGTGDEVDTETDTPTDATVSTDLGTDSDTASDAMDDTDSGSEIEMPTEGLVAYYPFNNSPNDESGTGNHGTVYGDMMSTTDRHGNPNSAYYFDGVDDHIIIEHSESLNLGAVGESYTIGFWINTTQHDPTHESFYLSKTEYLVVTQRPFYFGIHRNTRNALFRAWDQTNQGEVNSTVPLNDGDWHFVVGVRDGVSNTVALYLDGMLHQLQETTIASSTQNDAPIYLGVDAIGNAGVASHYEMTVDDLRIYNRALTAQEIVNLNREGGWETECTGQPDFVPCSVVTEPDRDYDICINGQCISPGCGDGTCNIGNPHFPIPDTGERECYGTADAPACTGAAGTEECASIDFCGQDAEYGWDSLYSAEERYSRSDDAEPIVTDNVTGLIWTACDVGQTGADCSIGSSVGYTWSDAVAYCDAVDWGGYTDWRLPDVYEAFTLASMPDAFPNSSAYLDDSSDLHAIARGWTSHTSTDPGIEYSSTIGSFNWSVLLKTEPHYIKCVRGNPRTVSQNRYSRVEDITDWEPMVQDTLTGLTWQGCLAGINGNDCSVGNTSFHTLDTALQFCEMSDWAGYTDWRVPNLYELRFIWGKYLWSGPEIVFPNMPDEQVFSSSDPNPYAYKMMSLRTGTIDTDNTGSNAVICVRGPE